MHTCAPTGQNRISQSPWRLALLLLALYGTTAVPAALAFERKARPGIGSTPAFVCVATTITERGHTKGSQVSRPSGNAQSDFQALRFTRNLKLVGPDGKVSERPARDVHLLIRLHQNGRFAFRVFELDEPLPEICSTPADA